MGTAKKSDGRYMVGVGVENANEYNGSMAYRDIVIQLTEDGATADSVNKLEYLRDYAEYHASIGEPIVPPNVSIWISGNGFSKAVEADDINITDSGFEIGGITYDGEAWDYSNAGQGSGGGSGGVYMVNVTWDEDTEGYVSDKTREEIVAAHEQGSRIVAFVDGYGYWPLTSMEITYDDDDNEYLVPYFRQNVFGYSGENTGEVGMVCTTIAINTDNVYFSQAEGTFDITPVS